MSTMVEATIIHLRELSVPLRYTPMPTAELATDLIVNGTALSREGQS